MASFGFPKRERLSRQRLWEEVFARGRSAKAYPLVLHYLKTELPEPVPAQAGFAVPKRRFRRAVDRNRVRRLMREAYRLEKPEFFNNTKGSFAFVFLYIGKELPQLAALQAAMRSLLSKVDAHEDEA